MEEIAKYVINLECRKDRRFEIEQQLLHVGWHAQFSKSERPTDACGFPSIGARGCFESHLSQLKRGAVFGCDVIIMEDDLNFSPEFRRLWPQALDALSQTDWSIFYPGHYLKQNTCGLTVLDPSIDITCTHFMMFHRNAIPTIITQLEEMLVRPAGDPCGGPMHVDGAYLTIRRRRPELRTYIISPSLGYQRSSRSDVAPAKLYDTVHALQPAMRLYRRMKNRR